LIVKRLQRRQKRHYRADFVDIDGRAKSQCAGFPTIFSENLGNQRSATAYSRCVHTSRKLDLCGHFLSGVDRVFANDCSDCVAFADLGEQYQALQGDLIIEHVSPALNAGIEFGTRGVGPFEECVRSERDRGRTLNPWIFCSSARNSSRLRRPPLRDKKAE